MSGEFFGVVKDMICVKDINGDIYQVHKTDPRYLSGELVHIWKGKNHTKETKDRMRLSKLNKYTGENASQYGKCWIYNDNIKENKSIKKITLNYWIEQGWKQGRKMNY